jgi:DNA-binding Xre family transcriptional regulator
MASATFERALRRVPEETHTFVGLSAEILDRLHALMAERGMNDDDLAQQMGISSDELAPMLSLGHNFTLRTIARLQHILGETLISVSGTHESEFVHH